MVAWWALFVVAGGPAVGRATWLWQEDKISARLRVWVYWRFPAPGLTQSLPAHVRAPRRAGWVQSPARLADGATLWMHPTGCWLGQMLACRFCLGIWLAFSCTALWAAGWWWWPAVTPVMAMAVAAGGLTWHGRLTAAPPSFDSLAAQLGRMAGAMDRMAAAAEHDDGE